MEPALAGDFELSTSKVLTIATGQTSSTGTVTITAVDNTIDAPDKTVTVSATASNSVGVVDPADVTLTITDDDDAPTITLGFEPGSIRESDNADTAGVEEHRTAVTASLSHPSSAETTVTVSAVTGFGADIGAGLAWSDPSAGLAAEIRTRGLLVHEESGLRERGVAGSLAWDPDPSSERGVSLSLRHTVGGPAKGA